MGNRVYICNLYKSLQIGRDVKFDGGRFETADPKLQALIERNNAFGSSIHWQDDVSIMEATGKQAAENAANSRARKRQELLDEMDRLDREDKEAAKRAAEDAEKERKFKKTEHRLKAADKVVASEQSPTIVHEEGQTEPPADLAGAPELVEFVMPTGDTKQERSGGVSDLLDIVAPAPTIKERAKPKAKAKAKKK